MTYPQPEPPTGEGYVRRPLLKPVKRAGSSAKAGGFFIAIIVNPKECEREECDE